LFAQHVAQLGPGLVTALLYCNGNNNSNNVFPQDYVLKEWNGWYKGVRFSIFGRFNQKEAASFILPWEPICDTIMHSSGEPENPAEVVVY